MNLEVARSTLLEHSRSAKNGKFPEEFHFEAKLTNPVCGDHVELRLHVQESLITDVGFKARACAICSASASLLTETIRNQSISNALEMGLIFENNIMEKADAPWPSGISTLHCFEHLRVNPARKMCALLPWVALKNAFKQEHK